MSPGGLDFDLYPCGRKICAFADRCSANKIRLGSCLGPIGSTLVWNIRRPEPWKFRSGAGATSYHSRCKYVHPAGKLLTRRRHGLLHIAAVDRQASQQGRDRVVLFRRYVGHISRENIFIALNGHEHALRWDAKRAEIPLLKVLKRPYILLLGSSAKHKNVHVILEQARGLDTMAANLSSSRDIEHFFCACARLSAIQH
jgi:hypothetical protein